MRRLLFVAGAVVLAAACESASPLEPASLPALSAAPGSSQAPTRQNYQVDMLFTTMNPCNGETVVLTGRLHFVTSDVYEEGSYTRRFHHNTVNFDGVGMTTGDRYTYVAVGNNDATFPVPDTPPFFPINGDVMQTYRVISRSGTDNYLMHTVYDYGFDEDGPYWNMRHMSQECRG